MPSIGSRIQRTAPRRRGRRLAVAVLLAQHRVAGARRAQRRRDLPLDGPVGRGHQVGGGALGRHVGRRRRPASGRAVLGGLPGDPDRERQQLAGPMSMPPIPSARSLPCPPYHSRSRRSRESATPGRPWRRRGMIAPDGATIHACPLSPRKPHAGRSATRALTTPHRPLRTARRALRSADRPCSLIATGRSFVTEARQHRRRRSFAHRRADRARRRRGRPAHVGRGRAGGRGGRGDPGPGQEAAAGADRGRRDRRGRRLGEHPAPGRRRAAPPTPRIQGDHRQGRTEPRKAAAARPLTAVESAARTPAARDGPHRRRPRTAPPQARPRPPPRPRRPRAPRRRPRRPRSAAEAAGRRRPPPARPGRAHGRQGRARRGAELEEIDPTRSSPPRSRTSSSRSRPRWSRRPRPTPRPAPTTTSSGTTRSPRRSSRPAATPS